MKRDQVYEIDEQGFLIEIYVEDFDEDGQPVNELPENLITVRPPDGLYRAKWTGTEWIEDKAQAEFEEEAFLESLKPTSQEVEIAEFELKVLTTLMEVGVI